MTTPFTVKPGSFRNIEKPQFFKTNFMRGRTPQQGKARKKYHNVVYESNSKFTDFEKIDNLVS